MPINGVHVTSGEMFENMRETLGTASEFALIGFMITLDGEVKAVSFTWGLSDMAGATLIGRTADVASDMWAAINASAKQSDKQATEQ
jgi:hypothetical protein